MTRFLLIAPLLVLAGCEAHDASTRAGRAAAKSTVQPRSSDSERVARSSKPAISSDARPRDKVADASGFLSPAEPMDPRPPEVEERKEEPPEKAPPIPDSYKPLNKDKKTIFFEVTKDGTRRVHLLAEVCLREGPLEVFLCKMFTKEHESILHLDADGREVHAALLMAKATPGHPVRYTPKYELPTGTRIKITLTYREKGKVKTCKAGEWVKDKQSGKTLATDWVFAGSKFFQDPEHPETPPYYTANQGEFICLSNFADAMLDVPIKSTKDDADLIFVANTPRIPPLGTPVIVTLEPVLEKKK